MPETNRRRALAFNAVLPALKAHDQWLPLSVRQAVADAVLATVADESESRVAQLRTTLTKVLTVFSRVTPTGHPDTTLGYIAQHPIAPADMDRWRTALTQPTERCARSAPEQHGNPSVQGRCPACGSAGLFLGEGGYVTCPRIGCTEPWSASTLLEHPARDKGTHRYLATSCHHGKHTYCQGTTGLAGAKTPAVCKFCGAPCICPCHTATA